MKNAAEKIKRLEDGAILASGKSADAAQTRAALLADFAAVHGGMVGADWGAIQWAVSTALPAMLAAWGATRDGEKLTMAPDSNSLRSARKRLLADLREQAAGVYGIDVRSGSGVTTYTAITAEAAEKAASEKAEKAASKKAEKAAAEAEAEATKIADAIAAATAGIVSVDSLGAHDTLRLLCQLAEHAAAIGIPTDQVMRAVGAASPADAIPTAPASADSLADLLASPTMGKKRQRKAASK